MTSEYRRQAHNLPAFLYQKKQKHLEKGAFVFNLVKCNFNYTLLHCKQTALNRKRRS